jgi:hypothetical protein
MLKISLETFKTYQQALDADFIFRLSNVLRSAVPSLCDQAPDVLNAQVRLVVDEARGYGLSSERAVGVFAVTAALLGLEFVDQFDGAREILLGPGHGDRKAELLEAFTLHLLEVIGS